jgi:hypothetical protein
MNKMLVLAFLTMCSLLGAVEIEKLAEVFSAQKEPFAYPLNIKALSGMGNEDVILCCHGYGSNSRLINVIHSYGVVDAHLVGFNFPDHDITYKSDHRYVKFGTVDELLPALYVLKLIVVDAGADKVSLYGFSAGGGAVVNMIGVLNTQEFDQRLAEKGITLQDKAAMLSAIQKGVILLDAPLKSMEEIAASKPSVPGGNIMEQNYHHNQMRPIDALQKWQGLVLNVVVFFQNPDEVLSNRDDSLFVQRVRQYNPLGVNKIFIADEGGHCGFHRSLWNAYNNLKS